MSAAVTRLQQVKLPVGVAPKTPEQQYWLSFKNQQQTPSPSSYPVTHISCPPCSANATAAAAQDLFAVTTGLRVQLYSIRTRKLVKTVTRFDDVAHSGEIRKDGRVMVAGDDTGAIQVFDVNSRAILKTWKEHKQPVWATKFSPSDSTTLLSASDDKTLRLWDLPSQVSTKTFVGHADYVRAASFLPGSSSNTIVSGSYDGTVRLWDPRARAGAAMTFKHAAPVESVLSLPSATTILASAGNTISVLDIVAGKPLSLLKNHQKTVTSLCLASRGTNVVSGGLDGHVKVFESSGWNVVAGSKYPSPILSLAVVATGPNQDDRHVAVGMQSGILSIRTRLSGQQKIRERERQLEMKALEEGTLEEFDKKKAKRRRLEPDYKFIGEGADIIIADKAPKTKKESPWEKHLRNAKYALALDTALKMTLDNTAMVTLLTALRHRSALRVALQGRDHSTLKPILRWTTRHIKDPRYMRISVELGLLIIDMYSTQMGLTDSMDSLVKELHDVVRDQVESAQQAWETEGMLNLLTAGDD
ncbi:MAG: hypothetical protein M1825_004002 [Sarcosagium campestre]|nr:MAG: hypothetical protein M1825_004002 [Sarcosagium campestre]